MRYFLIFVLFFILYCNITEAQTYANIAGPENVLVVYNSINDSLGWISDSVKTYYQNVRNIPSVNICPIEIPLDSTQITVDNVTHWVGLRQRTDIIRDIDNYYNSNWFPTYHAWQYYYTYVAAPIKQYIDNHNLTNTIRYIVLCKGVPFKIEAAGDVSANANVTVESLLCMLNTDDYEGFIQDIYEIFHQHSQPDPNYNYTPIIYNPYCSGTYGIDPDYNFNWRFSTDYFSWSWSGHTVKLSYLVSHLDGISYDVVKDMIDRSKDPDMSGTATWVIDDDPQLGFYSYFTNTKNRLQEFGFNYVYNDNDNWITSYSGDVIGYTSKGTHAEDGNCNWEDSAWVVDSLHFNWANGALYNSLESFNGQSMSALKWRYVPRIPLGCNHTQGLATQSTVIGGTSFEANGWEPVSIPGYNHYFLNFTKTYPAYAMGYSVVDAIYQGIPYFSWVNAVVGDPLTTIAWGKQNITSKTEMSDTNLVTDTLNITSGDTLIIKSGSHINLKRHGFITGLGRLIVESNVTFSTDSWQRALLLAAENNHPKLVWSNISIISPITRYLIYRKYGSGSWSQITSTQSYNWVDTTVNFATLLGTGVQYKIKAINDSEESDYSNTVEASVTRAKENAGKIIKDFSYNLDQNYPNPFNPTTSITYEIAKTGTVSLKVYDILGREAVVLVNEIKQPGRYTVQFDASELSSGVYFYRISANDYVAAKKMIVIK